MRAKEIKPFPDPLPEFRRICEYTVVVIYFYVFMEWIFFVTKPSFMDLMTFSQKISTLFLTGLIFSSLFLILLLLGFGILLFLRKIYSQVPVISLVLVPALIIAMLILLLVDNFTYTVFHFGVVTTTGLIRGVYGVSFLFIVVYGFRSISKFIFRKGRHARQITKQIQIFAYGLLLLSGIFLTINLGQKTNSSKTEILGGFDKKPNIILIGCDGVNADHTSVYGYERDTTPNLRKIAQHSLVAENAFSNAGNTAGSVVSILTGKYPTETRVLYVPDILTGQDAFQHLPGLLHAQGYYTEELGVKHYLDAYDLNVQNGFDEVNERQGGSSIKLPLVGFNVEYFFAQLVERISARLLHIFYIKDMENPLTLVLEDTQANINDQKKVKQAIKLVEEIDAPVFIHVHFMRTHGPKFHPKEQVFSQGETQVEYWMPDFYDDAIHECDANIGKIFDSIELDHNEETIIVIYSDHNMKFSTDQRVPLLISFPNGDFAGRIKNNVQNMDIAPTLLDYLGVDIPEWMEGVSLLRGEPDKTRLIFSVGVAHLEKQNSGWIVSAEKTKPPFFQFGYVGVVNCGHWYKLDLINLKWASGTVISYEDTCSEGDVLSFDQIEVATVKHLREKDFDVSQLETTIKISP